MKRARVLLFALLAMAGFALYLASTTNRAMATRQLADVHQPIAAREPDAPAVGCVPVPSGMVSWWPFDGNANDFQVTNNAITSGSPAVVPGEVAQALNFDGSDDHVKVNASSSLNVGAGAEFTIDFWVNPADVSQQRPLVEWNNGIDSHGVHLWLAVPVAGGGPGSLFANIKEPSGTDHFISSAPGALTANTYQHVALVFVKSAGIALLYVNGNIVASEAFGSVFTPQTSFDLYFGVRPATFPAGTRYVGQMDELELFNRALGQSEIQAIYNAGSAGKCKVRYVTNTNNSGAGSLRQAIDNGNNYPGADTIHFNIPGSGVHTIAPTSGLPFISGPLTIDGTTQSGFAGTPIIELSGAMASQDGLVCTGPVTIKGLVINGFFAPGRRGIDLFGSGSIITGNYIGTDATGNFALGNDTGIEIASQNNIIGGVTPAERNVISGNVQNGIKISPAAGGQAIIVGNYIGTNAAGNAPLGNGSVGIRVETSGNTIGGTATGARNIISANGADGILITGTVPTTNNLVQGNFIGTDATGTLDLGNVTNGIRIENFRVTGNTIGGAVPEARNVISGNNGDGIFMNSSGNFIRGNYIGTDVTGTQAIGNSIDGIGVLFGGNHIGGLTPAERNVISGNGGDGIFLGSSGNFVQGNYLGTNAAGTQAIGNGAKGIRITAGSNQIGGTTAAERNVISGNLQQGIEINGSGATQNLVQGNYIGVNAAGTGNIGNGAEGVHMANSAVNNIIGGTTANVANVIGYNGGSGVIVSGFDSVRDTIAGNPIFSNGGLGIHLVGGANNLQNSPILTSAISSGGNTTIQGTLNSTANTGFRIELFSNSACDPSGRGEGQAFIDFVNVNTDPIGNGSFMKTVPTASLVGPFITATATNATTGDTSEFSPCFTAPTEVTLVAFNATAYPEGVAIAWQTGFEVNNLGFRLHRQQAGKLSPVNQQLIAGSALKVGAGVRIESGGSYTWWDGTDARARGSEDAANVAYWLEDVDLSGRSTWHGPFAVQESAFKNPQSGYKKPLTELLSNLGDDQADSSRSVETVAAVTPVSAERLQTQSSLARQAAVKISVRREGWYRISRDNLLAAGLPHDARASTLQLFVDGEEVPIIVSTSNDGQEDVFSAIEFYGIGLDTPSTDERVYWLVAGKQPGKRIRVVQEEGTPSVSSSFTQTIERRDCNIYFPALLNRERENFFGPVVSTSPLDQSLTLSHLDESPSAQAVLEVALQGVTQTAHQVFIYLNNTFVGFSLFDGQEHSLETFTLPQALLREGANTVRLIAQKGTGDVSLVDHLRIGYAHSFTADDDKLRLTVMGGEQVTIGGFTSKEIRVFDVTDPNAVTELTGTAEEQPGGDYQITVAAQTEGERTLLALAVGREMTPAQIRANQKSNWRATNNSADFVMITVRDFFSALEPLRLRREGEGLRVAVVDIEDIYDEFNFGQKSPQAVKEFLAFARANWKRKPQFLLLAGDASFDPRNYLGTGDGDLVPTRLLDTTYLETASDDWFSDFNGDGMAEVATGRLPARTANEVALFVAKIISREAASPVNEALLVADANDGFNFEQASRELLPLLPPAFRITQLDRGRVEAETAKKLLLDSLHRGPMIVNYIGHGSANQWRGDLLTSVEARALTNGGLPVMVMMTCLNGYFHDALGDSLAESLLKAERGGAVAVWASSGMALPHHQSAMNQELYRLLFSPIRFRLGEAIIRAKASSSDPDLRRTWILLADPTARVQ